MKKVIMFLAGVLMLTSCGSTEGGLFTGATFGSIIGSCIGGISGGPRGSDIGTLVGMAAGAATGAAIGAANEQQYYAQAETSSNSYSSYRSSRPSNDESGYSSNGGYDDSFTMQPVSPSNEVTDTTISINALQKAQSEMAASQYPVTLSEVRFINDSNTEHIGRGELVKISFELRNTSGGMLSSLVPTVQETTGNKRLMISPSTMIESLAAGKVLRYTTYISAQKNLKTGVAHFVVSVKSNGATVSNVVEFDIPLN